KIDALALAGSAGSAALLAQEVTTQSKVDLCCATLNSKVDTLSTLVAADFITLLSQEITVGSKVDICCATLNSRLDVLSLCNAVPVVVSSTGTTISLAGTYCLAND